MSIDANFRQTMLRLNEMIKNAQPDSLALRTALTRIGTRLITRAQYNIQRGGDPPSGKPIVDTGNLRKSIRYEFFRTSDNFGIKFGSFGVPYAAVHEFGFRGIVNVKAHTRMVRGSSEPSNVRAHSRFMNIRARPYLRPAISYQVDDLLQILQEAMVGE